MSDKFPLAGVSLVQLRKVLDDIIHDDECSMVTSKDIARVLKVGEKRARAILASMIEQGYVQREPHHIASLGQTLRAAKFMRRIPRSKAEAILADMLARCAAVNANPDLLSYVKEVHAYGSYITKRPDLGDIDLCVTYAQRYPAPYEGFRKWRIEVAQAAGRSFNGSIMSTDAFWWPDTEVRLMVKGRQRYLSIQTDLRSVKKLGVKPRLIWRCGKIACHPKAWTPP
jgi:hypothetical protein